MKNANSGTRLDQEPKHPKPPESAPQTGKNPNDARESERKLQQNQQELGVGEDHKTDAMQQGGRGTFP